MELTGNLEIGAALSETDRPPVGRRGLAFDVTAAEVAVNGVKVTEGGDTATTGWWATSSAEGGRLEVEPLKLRAPLTGRLQDTRPIMEILGEKNVVLEWLDAALTVRDVEASATLDLDPGRLRLESLDVRGDKFQVEGWLELGRGDRRGLLFVGYHGLSAAVSFEPDGKRDWNLTRSRRWFERQLRDAPP